MEETGMQTSWEGGEEFRSSDVDLCICNDYQIPMSGRQLNI